jgi:hypothetical protein
MIVLILTSTVLPSQQARVQAQLRGDTVYGAVQYLDSHSQEVLASLWEGMRAEITFQLRLYRRSRGVFSFLGDRLLVEYRVQQTAAFDFYENQYKIQRDGETVGRYTSEAAFLEAFFSLPETEIGAVETGDVREHYVLARVRMMPVKIIAPLNIITLFSSEASFTTPWMEAELKL